jgi:hypothetical protein
MKGFAAKRDGREEFATVGHSDAASGAVRPLLRNADPIIHCGPNALLAAEV